MLKIRWDHWVSIARSGNKISGKLDENDEKPGIEMVGKISGLFKISRQFTFHVPVL